MAKKNEIADYNLMLRKYIDNKSYVKIFRTVCGEEENLSGFILSMSRHFLLLQLDRDFILDGYAVIRLNDFDSIRHSSYERTRRKIFNAEGLLATGYGFDKKLPLTSWKDILKALKGYDLHVIVENVNKEFLDFWIGEITNVTTKSMSIHNYSPDGQLDDEPKVIKLDTISVLTFGDRYTTTFRKYLRNKPRQTK